MNVHMALFSERRATPGGSRIQVDEQGRAYKEQTIDDPGVVYREIEVDVIMDEVTTIALRDWLN